MFVNFPDSNIFNSGFSPQREAIFSEICEGAISNPSNITQLFLFSSSSSSSFIIESINAERIC